MFERIANFILNHVCDGDNGIFCSLFTQPANIQIALICLFPPLIILFFSRKNLRLPIVQAIPGFCTAVGIMFTFYIIYDTLGVNDLFKDNNLSTLQGIVKTLSLKFSCSLIGVFFSIFWNIIIKWRISYLDIKSKKILDWQQKDPHELLWSMDQRFAELVKINSSNNEAIFSTSRQQEDLLRRILKAVDDMGNEAMEDMRGMLESLKKTLEQTVEQMGRTTLEGMQKNLDVANKDYFDSMIKINEENQKKFEAMMGSSAGNLSSTLDKLNEISNQIQQQLENTRDNATSGANTISEGFKQGAEAITGKTTTLITEIQSQFENLNQKLIKLATDLQSSTQGILDDNLNKVEKAFARLSEIQVNSIERLDSSTKLFNEAILAYKEVQDNQGEVLVRVQDQLNLLAALQSIGKEQLDKWKLQVDQMKDMGNRVEDIGNTIVQLQGIKEYLAKNNPNI